MRCLALAQAWKDGVVGCGGKGVGAYGSDGDGQVQFICAALPPSLEDRLRREGCEVVRIQAVPGSHEDIEQTLNSAPPPYAHTPKLPHAASWLVTDGYPFDAAYQRAIRAAGFKLLVIDDYNHLPEYDCDILLNQNIGAETYRYKVNPEARLLMGPRYALLRREFRTPISSNDRTTPIKSVPTPVKNVLVTLGGSDANNVTLKVIEALKEVSIVGLHVKVLLGAANPHAESVRAAATSTAVPFELITASDDMPSLMRWADIAVSAGGSTCWELCLFQVPMILIVLAENQRRIVEQLVARGAAVFGEEGTDMDGGRLTKAIKRLLASPTEMENMKDVEGALVDGEGVLRVVSALSAGPLRLRPVTDSDEALLLSWANDPLTRSASFATKAITAEEHRTWLRRRLNDAASRLFIAEDDKGRPVGHVRFEPKNSAMVVSINLSPEARGQRLAAILIVAGTVEMARVGGPLRIEAYIKSDNERSVRAFREAGYRPDGEMKIAGESALRWVWESAS